MLRKFYNYLAVLALCAIVSGGSVFANSNVSKNSKNKKGVKSVKVADDKDFQLYSELLHAGAKHSYTIKVSEGEQVKVKIHSANGVAVNIQTPAGQTETNQAEKYFELKLTAAGEYTIDVQAPSYAQYTMEVFNK